MDLQMDWKHLYTICNGWNDDIVPPFATGDNPLDPGTLTKCMVHLWIQLGMVNQVHHPHPKGGIGEINEFFWGSMK